MKSSVDNSQLDTFLKDTLMAADSNLQPIDWSEVEVLLRHEKKSIPIPVEINKKTITYSIAGVIAIVLVFGIFKIVQHYSSLPPEPETTTGATESTFAVMDTITAVKADTVVIKADTSHLTINPPKIDSSVVNISDKKSDITTATSQLMSDSAWIKRIHEKKDKKKKQNALNDSVIIKTDAVQPPADPAPAPSIQEIKIENPAPTDTSNKNSSAPQNNSKKKKSKSKKTADQPIEIKSDSLKQQ